MQPNATIDGASRRSLLKAAALAMLATPASIATAAAPDRRVGRSGTGTTGFVTTQDGTQIFYKDWGAGQPIVFSHGWPLTADDWDAQMMFFAGHGHRVIAHDRRGHGRSSQTWSGNDMDTYADDLREVVLALDLHDAIHVGHSTGGGGVTRYLAHHGTDRAEKAAIISAIPPVMIRKQTNPEGLPREVFDSYRAALLVAPSPG